MSTHTLSVIFHALSVAMLAVWAVESARSSPGTKSLLVCGTLMAVFGFTLPLAM